MNVLESKDVSKDSQAPTLHPLSSNLFFRLEQVLRVISRYCKRE
jgi:hypothetical protein